MLSGQKLLVANRGEIAVRILRTAKQLGLATLAIYSPSDALAPHVTLADEAVALPINTSQSESIAYLDESSILSICRAHSVTLIHPGYGFLSENAHFASLIVEAGITWLGPRPETIKMMGLKHEARNLAVLAGLLVVPGSDGLVTADSAIEVASKIGFPLMLKATAGGGGLGMALCFNKQELVEQLSKVTQRAQVCLSCFLYHLNSGTT